MKTPRERLAYLQHKQQVYSNMLATIEMTEHGPDDDAGRNAVLDVMQFIRQRQSETDMAVARVRDIIARKG